MDESKATMEDVRRRLAYDPPFLSQTRMSYTHVLHLIAEEEQLQGASPLKGDPDNEHRADG